jgi:hypothetical protein
MIEPTILAIDPGSDKSGWVIYAPGRVIASGVDANRIVRDLVHTGGDARCSHMACEVMRPRGEPFSSHAMETLIWVGRFMERWHDWADLDYFVPVVREDSKRFICGKGSVKDANVRQGCIELVGPPGTKKTPGPTFGVSSHAWQALAVALTAMDILVRRGGRRRARM